MPPGFLIHPLARGLDIDSPETTRVRQRIVREKPFLRRIYEEWYDAIIRSLPAMDGPTLEIGTGAGFLSELLPDLITSDVFPVPGLRMVLNSCQLPFASASLRAIVMTDVFHHIPGPRQFLREAERCLRPGGALIMIEPWHSIWSQWVYGRLHHEPYRPHAERWEFPSTGPLSGANMALPWIVFARDRSEFISEYPGLQLVSIRPMMPFRYLLSGGVSCRSLTPGWTFPFWRAMETLMEPLSSSLAMFAQIVLKRTSAR